MYNWVFVAPKFVECQETSIPKVVCVTHQELLAPRRNHTKVGGMVSAGELVLEFRGYVTYRYNFHGSLKSWVVATHKKKTSMTLDLFVWLVCFFKYMSWVSSPCFTTSWEKICIFPISVAEQIWEKYWITFSNKRCLWWCLWSPIITRKGDIPKI